MVLKWNYYIGESPNRTEIGTRVEEIVGVGGSVGRRDRRGDGSRGRLGGDWRPRSLRPPCSSEPRPDPFPVDRVRDRCFRSFLMKTNQLFPAVGHSRHIIIIIIIRYNRVSIDLSAYLDTPTGCFKILMQTIFSLGALTEIHIRQLSHAYTQVKFLFFL